MLSNLIGSISTFANIVLIYNAILVLQQVALLKTFPQLCILHICNPIVITFSDKIMPKFVSVIQSLKHISFQRFCPFNLWVNAFTQPLKCNNEIWNRSFYKRGTGSGCFIFAYDFQSFSDHIQIVDFCFNFINGVEECQFCRIMAAAGTIKCRPNNRIASTTFFTLNFLFHLFKCTCRKIDE